MHSLQHQQRGVTLVEIMIAITVGLILTTGLVQIFIGSKQAYKLQDSLGLMQENGRFALATLSRSIHMADHWGGIEPDAVRVNGVDAFITGIGGCDGTWLTRIDEGIRGYEGAATIGGVAGFPAGCIQAGEYVPNSDILVVRYASPETVDAVNDATTVYVRSAVGNLGSLMLGSAAPPATLPDQDGTYNFVYRTDIYYLRTCSEKVGGVCNDNIPALVRLTLRGDTAGAPSLEEEVLADNIEQLQFRYGRDMRSNRDTNNDGVVDDQDKNTGSDGDVDRYDDAGVGPVNGLSMAEWWARVVNVQVALLARSKAEDPNHSDTATYDLLGYNYTVPAADSKYLRKQYSRLVQVRNRTRS